jgi:hypothetical protein
MRFETNIECPACNTPIVVFPAYLTVSKITQRSLPAWKRCECKPRLQEITTSEFDALVPGWTEIINPGDPNEKLED